MKILGVVGSPRKGGEHRLFLFPRVLEGRRQSSGSGKSAFAGI